MAQPPTPTNPDRYRDTTRVALVGAVVNLVLSVVKILVGIAANSQSLIADGIHSVSDLLSDGLVYLAAHHARHGPDEEHPYGHGRYETAATMGLGVLLILVAAGIVWGGAERMFGFHDLLQPGAMALYAAVFSIIANEALYHYTMRVGRRINSDMLRANAWHHRSDSISSVVVLVGVAGTMAGLPYLDAVAAVIVGLMIAKIGWDLGWSAMQELVDAGLAEERLQAIRKTIMSVAGARDVHMLRTRRIGGYASADVHVQVEPRLSVSEGHMIAQLVENRLKQEIEEIDDVTVHIDPEDDQTFPACADLPPRPEALRRLATLWQGVDGAEHRQQLVLHYLGGRINVDAYFPLAHFPDSQRAEQLRGELARPLAGSREFGTLRVFFSL
jgi:cation diffusion facilitator family transporter